MHGFWGFHVNLQGVPGFCWRPTCAAMAMPAAAGWVPSTGMTRSRKLATLPNSCDAPTVFAWTFGLLGARLPIFCTRTIEGCPNQDPFFWFRACVWEVSLNIQVRGHNQNLVLTGATKNKNQTRSCCSLFVGMVGWGGEDSWRCLGGNVSRSLVGTRGPSSAGSGQFGTPVPQMCLLQHGSTCACFARARLGLRQSR